MLGSVLGVLAQEMVSQGLILSRFEDAIRITTIRASDFFSEGCFNLGILEIIPFDFFIQNWASP
jgi:hypothetical protein